MNELAKRMSPKMRAALDAAATEKGLGSWDAAAGVLGAIKRRGWVELKEVTDPRPDWMRVVKAPPRYFITPAGEEARRS